MLCATQAKGSSPIQVPPDPLDGSVQLGGQHFAAAKGEALINNLVGWHLLIVLSVLAIAGIVVVVIVTAVSRLRK